MTICDSPKAKLAIGQATKKGRHHIIDAGLVRLPSVDGDACGCPEAGNQGHWLSSRAETALLPATERTRGWGWRRRRHVKRADTHWAIAFVGGQTEVVDVLLHHIDGDLSQRLRSVAVKKTAAAVRDGSRLRDRLDHARFVVSHHDRGKEKPFATKDIKRAKIQLTVSIDRGGDNLEAAL
jgi:hypothetical protein